MKTAKNILFFIFFLSTSLMSAQEAKESRFSHVGFFGFGYGIAENENQPNYNLNSINAEILFNYSINKKIGVASGIEINQLSGQGFNTFGNFYHERTLLKIPVLVTLNTNVSENISFFSNFGFYGQTIGTDEFRYLNNIQRDVYEGWNFGAQVGIGFLFKMFDRVSAGIKYNGQTDFSSFKTNDNVALSNEQKMKYLNTIGLVFKVQL